MWQANCEMQAAAGYFSAADTPLILFTQNAHDIWYRQDM